MARAMPTQARCPPESWCGNRPSSSNGETALQRCLLNSGLQRRAAQTGQAAQRIGDRIGGGEARIDTFAGVLKHHLDMRAVVIASENTSRDLRHRAAIEPDLAIGHVEQPGDQPHQRRFPASGLADQAQCFARLDGQADRVNGMHMRAQIAAEQRPPADGKPFADAIQFQQRGHAASLNGAPIGFQHATPWPAEASRIVIVRSQAVSRRSQRAA